MDLLVFPHQLFQHHPGLSLNPERVVLIEDSLFFGDAHYPTSFHKQKLWLHRATMKRFEGYLKEQGHATLYLGYDWTPNSLGHHLELITKNAGTSHQNAKPQIAVADPVDFILHKRILRHCNRLGIECQFLQSPGFINSSKVNREYRETRKRWFMADFYKFQRKRLDILVQNGEPAGGKWSFDQDNRKKVPRKLLNEIPPIPDAPRVEIDQQARTWVHDNFPDNPGHLDCLYLPASHRDAENWLEHFFASSAASFR